MANQSLTITSLNKAPLEERAAFAGYTIPSWSDLPGCEFGLDVIKKGVFIERIDICNQPLVFVGRNADVCDIVPEHPSLSRIHACIQMGQEGRIEIMDFKSTHGTYLNGEQIKPFAYTRIYVGDSIQFGGSLRMYTLTGPENYMRPEQRIELKDEDRRSKESPKEEKKVRVPKLKIRYLGERGSGMNEELQRQLQEGTWGFDEDAVEDEDSMTLLGSNFDTSDLTEVEQRQFQKIKELRAKRNKMQSTKRWKNEKENREETLSKLENQIDSLEQSLYDSVERRRYREGHKRGMRERLLDEEDDYFDRTDRKSKRNACNGGQKKMLDSKEILQEKLSYKKKMLEYYEQQLKKCESNPVVQKECEDPFEAFMNANDVKLHETKYETLRTNIDKTRNEITEITSQLAKLALEAPPSEKANVDGTSSSTTAMMSSPVKVLRLKSDKEINDGSEHEITVTRMDTSTFTVVESGTPMNKSSSRSNKSGVEQSGTYLSSFGSVMEAIKTGKNKSYDDEESTPRNIVVTSSNIVSIAPERDPSRSRRGRRDYSSQMLEGEGMTQEMRIEESKPRDMSEYHVPEGLNVAVNQNALDEVVKEMGSQQPAFMKRMIDDLKKK